MTPHDQGQIFDRLPDGKVLDFFCMCLQLSLDLACDYYAEIEQVKTAYKDDNYIFF